MAAAVGMNLKLWGLITSAWLGLAVGLAIRVSGMLYTFGCLVLPALIAKSLGREVCTMFCGRSPGFLCSRGPGLYPGQPLRFPPGPDDGGLTLSIPVPGLGLAPV